MASRSLLYRLFAPIMWAARWLRNYREYHPNLKKPYIMAWVWAACLSGPKALVLIHTGKSLVDWGMIPLALTASVTVFFELSLFVGWLIHRATPTARVDLLTRQRESMARRGVSEADVIAGLLDRAAARPVSRTPLADAMTRSFDSLHEAMGAEFDNALNFNGTFRGQPIARQRSTSIEQDHLTRMLILRDEHGGIIQEWNMAEVEDDAALQVAVIRARDRYLLGAPPTSGTAVARAGHVPPPRAPDHVAPPAPPKPLQPGADIPGRRHIRLPGAEETS